MEVCERFHGELGGSFHGGSRLGAVDASFMEVDMEASLLEARGRFGVAIHR